MKKRLSAALLAMALAVALLAGCGSGQYAKSDAVEEAYYDSGTGFESYDGYAMEEDYDVTGLSSAEADIVQVQSNRKLITTVSMTVETESFDMLTAMLEMRAKELGGYAEYSRMYTSGYDNARKSASYTFRIPEGKLDEFLNTIGDDAKITYQSKSTEDVTLNYVDMESRVSAIEAEEEALRTLLLKAEDVSDIITIQSELTSIRYEKEYYASQLRMYDNQVQYSTVSINVEEPGTEEEPGVGSLGAVLLIILCIIGVLAVLAAIVFVIVKLCKRRIRKRKAAKAVQSEAAAQPAAEQPAALPEQAEAPSEDKE